MQPHKKVLTTPEEVRELAATLASQEMIGLDTEFIRESTFYPIIALIQVSSDQTTWLIDPLALKDHDLKPFFDVLQNPKIIKVLHAAQADQECFYTTYGIVASPSFDTALAASLCGYGDSIGLAKLLKEAMGVSLQKGHARTDWTVRPIPEHLMVYAHHDVQHLIPLARKLFAQLDAKERRPWAFELSARAEEMRNYEPNPEGIALKLSKSGRLDRRGLAALRELVAWRERRVRELDVPRRRVADDDVLMDLAQVRPKDMNHLSAFRGLNRGEFKHSGEAILAAVQRAARIPEPELPEIHRPEIPSPEEARAIELIQCFLKILADDLQILSRHLIATDDILPLLRRKFETVADLVQAHVLSEGAARLIGAELLAMVRGQRALSVGGGTVRVNRL